MRLIKTLLATAAALIFAGASAQAGVISLPLSGATGGTPQAANNNSPNNLLNDGFAYDPAVGSPPAPNQTNPNPSQNLFLTQNNDANNWWQALIAIAPGQSLEYLDVWGRNPVNLNEEPRHKDLVITLSDGVNAPWVSSPWDGVVSPEMYGRFDFAAAGAPAALLTSATSVRIDHSDGSNQFLLLAEVRAAGSEVPEPAGAALTLLGLGALVAFRRRR